MNKMKSPNTKKNKNLIFMIGTTYNSLRKTTNLIDSINIKP